MRPDEINSAVPNLASTLSPDELDALAAILTPRALSSDERLLQVGEQTSTLYFVRSGSLRASIEHDGKQLALGELQAGTVLGATSMLKPQPSTISVIADEPTSLITLSHEDFARLRQQNPNAAGTLLRFLSLALADRLTAYEEYRASDAEQDNQVWFAELARRLLIHRGR